VQYETPLWALIGAVVGAIIGFFLSFITTRILNKRNYEKLLETAISKIVSYIRDNNLPVAIKAISEIEASFKESDQIKILERASFESSLNASNNKITEYILEKFEWMMIGYNVYQNGTWNLEELELEEKKEKNKTNKIHSIMWTILRDVVEYHQSESIIKRGFQIIEDLDKYSLMVRNYELLQASIILYLYIGKKSIGSEYLDGFQVLNFQPGIKLSINYLQRMKKFISNYSKDADIKEKLLNNIERSIKDIRLVEATRLKKSQN